MNQTNPEHENLSKLGEGGTHPKRTLETFPNRNTERDYVVELKTNEFTCLCPKTGQPDFAYITIKYIPEETKFDLIFVATGFLHNNDDIFPEKSIKDLSEEKLKKVFHINTIGPALIGKHFIPYLAKTNKSVFAFLSAKVGSISDNKIGGWYSYRSSKTALNQIIKNFSIEIKRSNQNAIFVGLQPGTVKSNLSKPFQKNLTKNLCQF